MWTDFLDVMLKSKISHSHLVEALNAKLFVTSGLVRATRQLASRKPDKAESLGLFSLLSLCFFSGLVAFLSSLFGIIT